MFFFLFFFALFLSAHETIGRPILPLLCRFNEALYLYLFLQFCKSSKVLGSRYVKMHQKQTCHVP